MNITSEQRAEPQAVGRAGCARYSAYGVLPIRQNESGTAEDIMPLSLEQRDKGIFISFLILCHCEERSDVAISCRYVGKVRRIPSSGALRHLLPREKVNNIVHSDGSKSPSYNNNIF